jgi:hypothetical protein
MCAPVTSTTGDDEASRGRGTLRSLEGGCGAASENNTRRPYAQIAPALGTYSSAWNWTIC